MIYSCDDSAIIRIFFPFEKNIHLASNRHPAAQPEYSSDHTRTDLLIFFCSLFSLLDSRVTTSKPLHAASSFSSICKDCAFLFLRSSFSPCSCDLQPPRFFRPDSLITAIITATNHWLALFRSQIQNFKKIVNCLHGVLNVLKNRITQMYCKSRVKSNEPN